MHWWFAHDTSRSRSWAQDGSWLRRTCRTLRTAPLMPTGPMSSCTSANITGSSCSVVFSGAAGLSGRETWQLVWLTPSSGRWATGSRTVQPRWHQERWRPNVWRSHQTLPPTQRAPRCLPAWEKVRWCCCLYKRRTLKSEDFMGLRILNQFNNLIS